jgi:2-polyprenyl-3-methyl-5-hydroxy-6-metoxy-1,4-benzoquinol methylase
VLDLGCGAGIPVARAIAAAGHHVVGVDASARQVALARANVPSGEFLHADMSAVDFATGSFDAAAAFYSITHVPRSQHGSLLRRIAGWLKPNGALVASLGARSLRDWRGEWMGTEMFFSHYDSETNLTLLRDAGFIIERAEELAETDERFLWVVARIPERNVAARPHGA